MWDLAFLILAFNSPSHAQTPPVKQEKVAIIFNGGNGDEPTRQGLNFGLDASDSQALYKHLHYDRVIVLSTSQKDPNLQPTAKNLTKIISGLTNTSTLNLEIVSHGISYGMSDSRPSVSFDETDEDRQLRRRFTSVPLSATESKIYEIENSSPGKYTALSFGVKSSAPQELVNPNVGIADLKKVLQSAQRTNPGLETNIYSATCYGASIARGLADVPKTQVFSSSQVETPAWTMWDITGVSGKIEYFNLYEKYLGKGLTYADAHDEATNEYLHALRKWRPGGGMLNGEEMVTTPRSASQEYVANWCLTRGKIQPIQTHAECQKVGPSEKTEVLGAIRKTNSITQDFFDQNPDIQKCRQDAASVAQIKVLKRELERHAFDSLEQVIRTRNHDEAQKAVEEDLFDIGHNPGVSESTQKFAAQILATLKNHDNKSMIKKAQSKAADEIRQIKAYCMDAGARPSSFVGSCEDNNLLATILIPGALTWETHDGAKLKATLNAPKSGPRHPSDKTKPTDLNLGCKLGTKINDPKKMQDELKCLQSKSRSVPIIAYLDSENIKYGEACPLLGLAAKAASQDRDCTESFHLKAECKDWERLDELHKMGSERLTEAGAAGSQKNSSAERIK